MEYNVAEMIGVLLRDRLTWFNERAITLAALLLLSQPLIY